MQAPGVIQKRTSSKAGDAAVLLLIGIGIYCIGIAAREWQGAYQPSAEIDLSGNALIVYAFFSMGRAFLAYVLSLGFTLSFGYLAAKNRIAGMFLIPLLDIGQSIPVLGFLPGLVLGLVSLFPKTNIGLELSCILMIFTGQVWNMAFSFISSMKSVPKPLYEMADNVGLSKLRQFFRVELPCSATGLAWNSLMSMAGGWFFLTVCEAFTLGEKNFRLPGLGSYVSVAMERGDSRAMFYGAGAMVAVIVFCDFLIWRPVIAWTSKFRLSESHDDFQSIPFMTLLFRESRLARIASSAFWKFKKAFQRVPASRAWKPVRARRRILPASLERMAPIFIYGALGFVVWRLMLFVGGLSWPDWREILLCAGFTGIRVVSAVVLGTLWALPAGIVIGLSPKLTRWFQPLIQIGASFPAPMIYPLALGFFTFLHIPIQIGSALLMLLGVQWYVLFNVLAGAVTISSDLLDSFRLTGVSRKAWWKKLYIPSVFPYLVTGWVTAAGGAWNASIVSEYVFYQGHPLIARGLGALISESTSHGEYPRLVACLLVMVAVVVLVNRLFWSRVYHFAETRYRFER